VLVDNAIKYNRPEGSVTVTVTAKQGAASISVADTGIGVAPEDIKRLGERFYRVDKARSRESGGAGLGLSIVRSIVSRHNGTLDIASRTNDGTVASISLPVVGSLNGR
jgi:signal transduction histidine kinase